jgi:hypothetical protein
MATHGQQKKDVNVRLTVKIGRNTKIYTNIKQRKHRVFGYIIISSSRGQIYKLQNNNII